MSVEPAGQEHVWDLMVEGTHAFIAEGLAVHNTRKHFDDLYARLIADTSYHVLAAAKSVFFPDGSPIWPEMWSIEALLERKKQLDAPDLLAWPQEYLNEPRPSETQMFYPEKWPTYANTPYSLTILQFWDLAISEKTNADYTCGWTIGVDEWLHRHRPSRRGQRRCGVDPDRHPEQLRQRADRGPPQDHGIEPSPTLIAPVGRLPASLPHGPRRRGKGW